MNTKQNKLLKKVASNIRHRRYELRLSQLQLAELVDCHVNSIGQIERGESIPSLLMVIKIADALDISLKDLMPD